MSITEKYVNRISDLMKSSTDLAIGGEYSTAKDANHVAECEGWLGAAANIVELVMPDSNSAYRKRIDRILSENPGYTINRSVGKIGFILQELLEDANAGRLSSITDIAKAEVFDDFLDHAKEYLRNKRKREAGVIAGVVFEDSIRQVCRNRKIPERGEKLDHLISELTKANVLTATKAKRARVSADVRTKATHAQWDEFDESDVKTTIEFVEEFIAKSIDP